MFQILLFMTFSFLACDSWAQFRDYLAVTQAQSDKSSNLFSTKIGLPPAFTESFSFFNSIEYKKLVLDNSYDLQALSYSLGVKYKINNTADIFAGTTISVRQNRWLNAISADSMFYTSYAFYNMKQDYSSYQFGLILLDKSAKYPAMPILGYGFESVDRKHLLKISYPTSYYVYTYDEALQLATTIAIERQTYRLYDFNADYLSTEKTVLAFMARQQLGNSPFFGSIRLGHHFKEKYFHSSTQTLKDNKQLIKEKSENFIELSLSYGKN